MSIATEWEHAARQRWAAWYVQFLSQYDSSNQDWSVFAVFDEERENILLAIEWTLANQHSGMLIIIQRFWYYLFMHGYWQECEKYAMQALDRASSEGNTSTRLWLTSHLGWLLSEREGTEQEAILRLRSVEDEILAMQRSELFEETNVLNYLGQAYRTLGDLDRAEAYQVRSLQLFQQVGNQQRALVSRYYLALIQFDRGQVEEAQQNYRDVLEEAQRIGYERAYCYCAYHLARALIGLNQFGEAEHWLNVTSELANHWDEPLLQAYVLFGRASLLRKQKQLVEAHNLAMAAVDAYRRLGSRDQHEAAELVAQLEEEMA